MYQNYNVCYYVQELQKVIEMQNNQIKKLEKDLQSLKKEIESIKNNKPFTIEKIEYKFDQLKVESLTGTLNIGITPGDAGVVEEVNVEGKVQEDLTFPKTKLHIDMFKNIIEQVEEYLESGILKEMQVLERKYNKTIDNDKRDHIINDLRKQIEKQINMYINQKQDTIKLEDIKTFENDTVNNLIGDINQALGAFVKYFPKEIN